VWIGNQIRANRNYVKKQVRKNASTDPYWHMVGLFYEQMEGVEKGKVKLWYLCCQTCVSPLFVDGKKTLA
jgi:hypothetical protein